MQTVSIIVAMDNHRVIGANGQIPWHLPADLLRFKAITMGHPIVMGRKTYESIGRPLPGRRNIVITRRADYAAEGCAIAHSFDEAMQLAGDEDIFVIGGAEIYEQALPIAKRVYLTTVNGTFDGDAYFPALDPSVWHEVAHTQGTKNEKNPYDYTFSILERRT